MKKRTRRNQGNCTSVTLVTFSPDPLPLPSSLGATVPGIPRTRPPLSFAVRCEKECTPLRSRLTPISCQGGWGGNEAVPSSSRFYSRCPAANEFEFMFLFKGGGGGACGGPDSLLFFRSIQSFTSVLFSYIFPSFLALTRFFTNVSILVLFFRILNLISSSTQRFMGGFRTYELISVKKDIRSCCPTFSRPDFFAMFSLICQ
ncbi:hypothetical protein CDAR_442091 [Caerostris darwini]|uniref:Uncharacterized protein n=1 Tax=Caerostris darwini TaxID=1538125 RepID=A0AAV4UZZ1_9ARAC|nr:hypothetical protein CDAR_442091 [Caerostris darwini]